ncbi:MULTISPECIES: site-specific integrase [Collinsella]|uniref:site-specific integrase n=1 Tax=Collinsella TaxID=102106 RepID=UPI0032C0D7EC
MHTGMRIGEVCGLRWCDVDFETGLISIRHSVAYAKGMGSFIKDTKTHDARGIPIDPVGLLPFLKETHEIDCGKLRLRGLTGAVEIGDCYILSEPGATFATTSYIRRAFKTFSETNGLMGTNDELITFHGLRHTFATQWIRQGGDIKAFQSILGHKDAMATLNVYADIEPISKIHNMLRATPCLWRGHLGPRVDPGPMFQQRIQESIETLQAFGYGITEPDDRNIAIRDVKTNSWL